VKKQYLKNFPKGTFQTVKDVYKDNIELIAIDPGIRNIITCYNMVENKINPLGINFDIKTYRHESGINLYTWKGNKNYKAEGMMKVKEDLDKIPYSNSIDEKEINEYFEIIGKHWNSLWNYYCGAKCLQTNFNRKRKRQSFMDEKMNEFARNVIGIKINNKKKNKNKQSNLKKPDDDNITKDNKNSKRKKKKKKKKKRNHKKKKKKNNTNIKRKKYISLADSKVSIDSKESKESKESKDLKPPKKRIILFGSGNGNNQFGRIKGCAKGPVKEIEKRLSKFVPVIKVSEFRTSKLCLCCGEIQDHPYHREKKKKKKIIEKFKLIGDDQYYQSRKNYSISYCPICDKQKTNLNNSTSVSDSIRMNIESSESSSSSSNSSSSSSSKKSSKSSKSSKRSKPIITKYIFKDRDVDACQKIGSLFIANLLQLEKGNWEKNIKVENLGKNDKSLFNIFEHPSKSLKEVRGEIQQFLSITPIMNNTFSSASHTLKNTNISF